MLIEIARMMKNESNEMEVENLITEYMKTLNGEPLEQYIEKFIRPGG
jgi:hypothetical protein